MNHNNLKIYVFKCENEKLEIKAGSKFAAKKRAKAYFGAGVTVSLIEVREIEN